MNTIENNKLIAEFMNWESNESKTVYYEPKCENQGIDGFDVENLPFNNWNWLMEVVEKIESLIFPNDTYYNFNILSGCYVTIIDSKINEFGSYSGSTKIESVYNACVEFVKWYNENK
jgi:hypothetical protein